MKRPTNSWRLLMVAAVAIVVLVAMAAGIAACGGSSSSSGSTNSQADTIVGAGASFPYPLYTKWGTDYAATGGAKLNYQSIGSGGGISAVTKRPSTSARRTPRWQRLT